MYKIHLFLLAVAFSLAGCIEDSYSDCVPEVKMVLDFEYYADDTDNVVGKYIHSADIYIYIMR